MQSIIRALVALSALASAAVGQTIYPIDRAQILTGASFDFKVEFPGAVAASDIKVTIDGEDAAKVLGREPLIAVDEDDLGHTAYWIRGVRMAKPCTAIVEATAGDKRATVTWTVYGTPEGRLAKNVILLIGDGMSMAHRTAARMLSKGIVEGRYGGELAMDDMPHMALVSTSGTDSIVTDSANAMTAYATGHKTCVNALGVYCALNSSTLGHPNIETIAELAKRRLGIAVGVVTDTEIEDATPAGMVAHTRKRTDYNNIVRMFYSLQPEVILGGGTPNFLPKGEARAKREDNQNYIEKFAEAGYTFVDTATQLAAAAAKPETTKLLGLFNDKNIDGSLDRKFLKKGTVAKFPDQPDLTDEMRAALAVLSRSDKGFLLMVEAGRIDKYSHSLDWERAVYDTIMLDNTVKLAKDFAAKNNDTLIIVVPDHAHPVSIIGTYDDSKGEQLRDRLQTYSAAQFPNYPAPDAEGYPATVEVSRRLAMVFAAYPDYCDPGKPYLAGENQPTAPTASAEGDKQPAVANEEYCKPGAARKIGNLPFTARTGVHAADDVVLTASGPGADAFRGRVDNTFVFRAMARALGLGS
ncbi:alkaline phosphatase [Hyphomicrobium sp. xq]|uniref:Alkaline phosphatase n=1 Tax=Hyphomicrobium album TaxID=2665159 RepID=A0A6I3KSK9_9HYPH|nr:alkaline phosphatase [Hyphomicrobium album]MTD96356.1 alkaline phosphatase [Hyphomicrobium album]